MLAAAEAGDLRYYINLLHYNNKLLLSLHFPDDSKLLLSLHILYEPEKSKLKIEQFTIAGAAENNSKIKTQNSKIKKESFYTSKGFVLVCKRSPFTLQKESFWKAKGPLLKNSRNFSLKQP